MPPTLEPRDFYAKHFGFEPAFETSLFFYLTGLGARATLVFMHVDDASLPPGPEAFGGEAMLLETR
ncbi:hypothetical protein [Paracoccus albus]|uniref:hypothetical protein n=1 Tax=Paracoccus albus TaxID=3017784 RepID=UPI0022F07658|nr:hypothetical protein [Paracoccus albus]WBU60093.1 hypothetical protein PAF20_15340 [Paracoccus albus]